MSKLLYTCILTIGLLGSSIAQDTLRTCLPDSAFLLSTELVVPTPFVSDSMGEGIPVEACINVPYDVVFFLRAPSQITVGLFNLDVRSIRIDSVTNLPEGINYECSVPDCNIQADSIACVFLSGTPTEGSDTGNYELKIGLTVNSSFGPLQLLYPDPALAPGTYILRLNEEGSSNCNVSPVFDVDGRAVTFATYPNPVLDQLQIEWESDQASQGQLHVYDATGRLHLTKDISIGTGPQYYQLDLATLRSGLYMVQLRTSTNRMWSKIIKR